MIQSGHRLDNVWKEIVMILVGFTLEAELDEIVTGAVVNARGRRSNIAVWVTDNNRAAEVGDNLRILLQELDSKWMWNAEYRRHN